MSGDPESQPTLAGLAVPAGSSSQGRTPKKASGKTPKGSPKKALKPDPEAASIDPIAEVVIDSHLAHLDRPFEYVVPADLDEVAQPGVRVRVRFAGRAIDGYLIARKSTAEHTGRLAPLLKVVSDEVVLTPHLARLCRDLADYYAGTLADVLRLAIPPRHARAEKAATTAAEKATTAATPDGSTAPADLAASPTAAASAGTAPAGSPTGWDPYPAGAALVRRLAAGEAPAAAWSALPDGGSLDGWPAAIASAVAATHASGRGSIVVVPDHRDVDRMAEALDRAVGDHAYVRLTADLGPEQRYSAWLRALRGQVKVVIGSRSAAFAPVHDLGLVAWWDDGDDNLQEPRAPYPHVREVLRRRAALSGAGLIAGGYGRTPAIQAWVRGGTLREVRASSAAVAAAMPRVTVAGEGYQGARDAAASSARMPSVAWRAVKDGLQSGPVLIQVPRRGYLVGLSCEHCRASVRCSACSGPLQLARAGGPVVCGWCGQPDDNQPCRQCGGTGRRSRGVGEERTAEEVGRSFPGTRVLVSRAGHILSAVPDQPAVVIATPGAEPVAHGGYAATLLLDGWALLDRGGLDSGVEALRRWMAAAALSRPGAPAVLVGVPPHAALTPVEALVRWDPVWLAAREVSDRVPLGLPPIRRTATVIGDAEAVVAARETLAGGPFADDLEVLGPISVGDLTAQEPGQLRLVIRSGEASTGGGLAAGALPAALHALRAARSLRRESGDLVVQLDSTDLSL